MFGGRLYNSVCFFVYYFMPHPIRVQSMVAVRVPDMATTRAPSMVANRVLYVATTRVLSMIAARVSSMATTNQLFPTPYMPYCVSLHNSSLCYPVMSECYPYFSLIFFYGLYNKSLNAAFGSTAPLFPIAQHYRTQQVCYFKHLQCKYFFFVRECKVSQGNVKIWIRKCNAGFFSKPFDNFFSTILKQIT